MLVKIGKDAVVEKDAILAVEKIIDGVNKTKIVLGTKFDDFSLIEVETEATMEEVTKALGLGEELPF